MTIEYVEQIPGSTTPARVFHSTGKIQINRQRWNQIPDEFHKKFILKHEEGHYEGRTNNEFFADEFAFNKLAGTEPLSLRKSITALTDVLPMTSPQHQQRVTAQTIRALRYDAVVNKNPKAFNALKQYYPWVVENISSFEEIAGKPEYKHNYKRIGNIALILTILILIIVIIKKL
jgi:hypothetical protein